MNTVDSCQLMIAPMQSDARPKAASLAATIAFLPEGKPAEILQQMVQQVLREAHVLAKLELPPAAQRVSFMQLRPPAAGQAPFQPWHLMISSAATMATTPWLGCRCLARWGCAAGF